MADLIFWPPRMDLTPYSSPQFPDAQGFSRGARGALGCAPLDCAPAARGRKHTAKNIAQITIPVDFIASLNISTQWSYACCRSNRAISPAIFSNRENSHMAGHTTDGESAIKLRRSHKIREIRYLRVVQDRICTEIKKPSR